MRSTTKKSIFSAALFVYWVASLVIVKTLNEHHAKPAGIVKFILEIGVGVGCLAGLSGSSLIVSKFRASPFITSSICYSSAMGFLLITMAYLTDREISAILFLELAALCAGIGIFVAFIITICTPKKSTVPDYPFLRGE